MSLTTLAEIIEAARALSPAERLQLLDAMWDAAHPEAWPAPSPEWLAEVRDHSLRRCGKPSDYPAGTIASGAIQ
jgi:hypothetical protein